jgi:hypothetical protein
VTLPELAHLAQVTRDAELLLRACAERLRTQRPPIRKKETVRNIERNDERGIEERPERTREDSVPEPRNICPSVVSQQSQIKENLRNWLTSHIEWFGLDNTPEHAVLDRIAAQIPDEASFARFTPAAFKTETPAQHMGVPRFDRQVLR